MKKLGSALLFVGMLVGATSPAHADVWKAENSWSTTWEDRYSKWVEAEWTQDVFKRGPLEGLETDCADATYAMRALFAQQNRLPFQVTTREGKVVSQSTSRFDDRKLETDRFRTFLKYVFDETNTKTLANDTYPIAMQRSSLRPGTLYLATGEHSYQVTSLSQYGVPVLLSSTTPIANRVLFRMSSFPFYRPETKDARDGYRAFRWPNEVGLNVRKISRASFEQYAISGNVMEFAEAAKKRLAVSIEPLDEQIDRQLTNICYFTRERAYGVVQAYLALTKKSDRCFSASERDEYSTEIRDSRIKDYFQLFRSLRDDPRWSDLRSAQKQKFLAVFIKDVPEVSDLCRIPLGIPDPVDLSLYDVWQATRDAKLVPDPTVSIRARWGLEPAVSMCRR
ncbi:MAG: hypothetical protein V4692_02740 [Bdellovibrionota bacterium]